MRRHSHLGSELPGEVRHAHRGEIAQILEAQSHLHRVFDIVRHHPQPMPAKSMPRRLGLTVAAILADQSSRNRKRKLVDMQRSEEHTSELQSLMRRSYAVFCLKKKKQK